MGQKVDQNTILLMNDASSPCFQAANGATAMLLLIIHFRRFSPPFCSRDSFCLLSRTQDSKYADSWTQSMATDLGAAADAGARSIH